MNVRHREYVGFILTLDINVLFFDADHIFEKGDTHSAPEWAAAIYDYWNSYIELSQSGTGFHGIGYGCKPDWLKSRYDMGPPDAPESTGFELYDNKRFVVFTGRPLKPLPLAEVDVNSLFGKYRTESKPIKQYIHSDSDHQLSVYSFLDRTKYPPSVRVAHPFHESSTGANFMVGGDGFSARCWHHECTMSAYSLFAVGEGIIPCGGEPSREQWAEVFRRLRRRGLIPDESIGLFFPRVDSTTVIDGRITEMTSGKVQFLPADTCEHLQEMRLGTWRRVKRK